MASIEKLWGVSSQHENRPVIWYNRFLGQKHTPAGWDVLHGNNSEGIAGLVHAVATERFHLKEVDVLTARLMHLPNLNPTWPVLPSWGWHTDQPHMWLQHKWNRTTNRWLPPVPPEGSMVVLMTINLEFKSRTPTYKVGVRNDQLGTTHLVVSFNDAYILCGEQATKDTHNFVFEGDQKLTLVAGLFAKAT
jgi:hypothetical protein